VWTAFLNVARNTPWLGRTLLHTIPDIRWTIQVPVIGALQIRLRRNRSLWLRPPLLFETFMLGALERLVRPGDVVYDIGANIGLYSRFLAQRFGAGTVVAFEPMAENRELLEANMRLGACQDRIRVLPIAVADYDGEDEFQVDDLSSASGALSVVTEGQACQGRRQYGLPPLAETVPVAALDSLLRLQRIPPPDVIKLDVEGTEERALRGARSTLRDHRPGLVMELHGAEVALAVVRFLAAAEYRVYGWLDRGENRVYQEILPEDYRLFRHAYSLHYAIASCEPARIQEPIHGFIPQKEGRPDRSMARATPW
jgi:FkbM family methyltransferase